jgi:hypothetical protein
MLKLIKKYMGARIQQMRAETELIHTETEQIHTEVAAQEKTAAQVAALLPVVVNVFQVLLDDAKSRKTACSAPPGSKSAKELVDLALSCLSELGVRRAHESLAQIATAAADAHSAVWPPPPPASDVRASAG